MKNLLTVLVLATIFTSVFSPDVYARPENHGSVAARDLLIKSQVETAVSMLQAIYGKCSDREMSRAEAKKLGADLLREMSYGKEGYFFVDTIEGVNVVLNGNPDYEGKNLFNVQDANGVFVVRELIEKAKSGGGYVDYLFARKGESVPVPKRSYAVLFAPFDWVVGTGYYPGKH